MNNFDWRNSQNWYVNLASRPDRNSHAHAEFARAGLPVRRLEGFTPEEYSGDKAKILRMQNRTPGAIGCWQSQAHAMRTMRGNDGMVGIFEDDVVFCDDLAARLDYIQEHLAWDWDIFWLGATFHCNPPVWHKTTLGRDVKRTTDTHIMRTYGIWCTYAYFVNGRSVDRVLTLLEENMHCSDGIDHCMILYVEPQLQTFCFVPGCCKQYDSQSNIGRGITRFSNFKSLGPYWFTEKLTDFNPDQFDWAEAAR